MSFRIWVVILIYVIVGCQNGTNREEVRERANSVLTRQINKSLDSSNDADNQKTPKPEIIYANFPDDINGSRYFELSEVMFSPDSTHYGIKLGYDNKTSCDDIRGYTIREKTVPIKETVLGFRGVIRVCLVGYHYARGIVSINYKSKLYLKAKHIEHIILSEDQLCVQNDFETDITGKEGLCPDSFVGETGVVSSVIGRCVFDQRAGHEERYYQSIDFRQDLDFLSFDCSERGGTWVNVEL